MSENPKTVVIACAVFRDVLRDYIADQSTPVIFMEYGLHLTPRKMRAAIQAQIDALEAPHVVLIGYGLCGNGLVGLKSRCHTLVIPCVDDCVALFLGSRAAYLREFQANPATYYLTPGWLECGGEPRSEHLKCCDKYGEEKASLISDTLYSRYRRACFIAFTPEVLEQYRPRAMQVADFCRERWGWRYIEQVGSDALIRQLLQFGQTGIEAGVPLHTGDFLIIEPGEEVEQAPFMLRANL